MGAYKSALEREHAAHLVEARELLMSCAKASCGTLLHQECAARYAQLGSDIPSIVPMVTDAAGAPRVDVDVTLDGEPLTSHLDGRSLPVDPGMHELAFSTNGTVFSKQKVLIVQGQRNRTISASLGGSMKRARLALEAPNKPAGESPKLDTPADPGASSDAGGAPAAEVAASGDEIKTDIPKLSYVLGGVGIAGAGTFALLTAWGRSDNNKLSQCAPACAQSSIDHIHRLYVAADVSLGVGLAAAGAAYWLYARAHNATQERSTEEAYRINVSPTPAGAVATVSGSF